MTLGKKQEKFSLMLSRLIAYIYKMGYQVRMGDVWAHDGHKENSNHYIKLAADINLFKDGKYLTETEDHKLFGKFWEEMGGSWGGKYQDGNHYSIEHNGRS